MIALYLHAPAHASDPPSYVIDSPGIVKWWDEQGTVGGYALIEVDKVLSIIRYEPGNDELKLALLRMEGFTMVRVDRRN